MRARVESWILKHAPRFIGALAVVAALLIAVAGYIITQYQPKTACEREPESHECQRLRAEGAKAQSKRVACIPFRQVGYLCPAPTYIDRGSGKPALPTRTEGGSDGGTQSSSGSSDSASPTGTVDSGGDGSSGGGDPGGGDGGGGGPSPEPPPIPGPEGPPGPPGPEGPPAPEPDPPGSALGLGVDVPILDECAIAPGLCR